MGFEFVLVNEKDSQEKVRRHLRNRQSELRRKKLRELKETTEALKASSIVGRGPLAWRHRQADDDSAGHDANIPEGSSNVSAPATRHSSITSSQTLDNTEPNQANGTANLASSSAISREEWTSAVVHVSSPQDILGSNRRNPFRTYPIPWNPELDKFLDLCQW